MAPAPVCLTRLNPRPFFLLGRIFLHQRRVEYFSVVRRRSNWPRSTLRGLNRNGKDVAPSSRGGVRGVCLSSGVTSERSPLPQRLEGKCGCGRRRLVDLSGWSGVVVGEYDCTRDRRRRRSYRFSRSDAPIQRNDARERTRVRVCALCEVRRLLPRAALGRLEGPRPCWDRLRLITTPRGPAVQGSCSPF